MFATIDSMEKSSVTEKKGIKKLIEVHVWIVYMKMSARAFIVKFFSDIRAK